MNMLFYFAFSTVHIIYADKKLSTIQKIITIIIITYILINIKSGNNSPSYISNYLKLLEL